MNKIRHHSASGGRPKTSLTGTRFHKRSTQNPILDAGRKVGCVPEQTFVPSGDKPMSITWRVRKPQGGVMLLKEPMSSSLSLHEAKQRERCLDRGGRSWGRSATGCSGSGRSSFSKRRWSTVAFATSWFQMIYKIPQHNTPETHYAVLSLHLPRHRLNLPHHH